MFLSELLVSCQFRPHLWQRNQREKQFGPAQDDVAIQPNRVGLHRETIQNTVFPSKETVKGQGRQQSGRGRNRPGQPSDPTPPETSSTTTNVRPRTRNT